MKVFDQGGETSGSDQIANFVETVVGQIDDQIEISKSLEIEIEIETGFQQRL